MNNKQKESPSVLLEAGEDFNQPTNSEQTSTLEVTPHEDVEVALDQDSSEQQEGETLVSGRSRLRTRARQAQQNFADHRRSGWTKKELMSHYLGKLKDCIAQPQGNLHETKQTFARLKAKFQALMSERR